MSIFSRINKNKHKNDSANIGSPNWMVLTQWLIESLSIEPEWRVNGNNTMTWWGGPLPTTISSTARYTGGDGIQRDVIDVRAMLGNLKPGYDKAALLKVLHEWNRCRGVGVVYLTDQDEVIISSGLNYSSSHNFGNYMILSHLLYIASWSHLLASELGEKFEFHMPDVAHPESGLRYDFDELTGNIIKNIFTPISYISEFTPEQYLEKLNPLLSQYNITNLELVKDDTKHLSILGNNESEPYIGVSIEVTLNGEGQGPGLHIYASTGLRFPIEGVDFWRIVLNVYTKELSNFISDAPGQFQSSIVTWSDSGEFEPVLYSFFPSIVLSGTRGIEKSAEVVAYLSGLLSFQAIKVRNDLLTLINGRES